MSLLKGVGSTQMEFGTTWTQPHETTTLSKHYQRELGPRKRIPPGSSPRETTTLSKGVGSTQTDSEPPGPSPHEKTTLSKHYQRELGPRKRILNHLDPAPTRQRHELGPRKWTLNHLDPARTRRCHFHANGFGTTWTQPHDNDYQNTIKGGWVHANGFGTTWTQPHDNDTIKTLSKGFGLRKQIWNHSHCQNTGLGSTQTDFEPPGPSPHETTRSWVHANGFGTTWTQPHDNDYQNTIEGPEFKWIRNHLDTQPLRDTIKTLSKGVGSMQTDYEPPGPNPTTTTIKTLSKGVGYTQTDFEPPGPLSKHYQRGSTQTDYEPPALSKGVGSTQMYLEPPGPSPHETTTKRGWVYANGFGTPWTQPHNNNTIKTLSMNGFGTTYSPTTTATLSKHWVHASGF
jgi:hypothetical protein